MTKSEKITSCMVCNAKKFSFLYSAIDRMLHIAGTFSVVRCQKCSLVFINPRPTQGGLKKYYPSKKYYSYSTNKKKGIFERLREYLVAHYYSPDFFSILISTFIQNVPAMPSYVKKGKILDIGCGAGDTLLLLKKLGWDTYGIDMDTYALENGRKNGLKNLKLGTYKSLHSYPDNYFDAIRLYHVIEHIDDPASCFDLIRKKLKPHGELMIGTPNIDSIITPLFKSYWYNLDIPRHLILFSPKTLGMAIKQKGFQVEKIEYCSAGGIVGSIQYLLDDIFHMNTNLIHRLPLVLLFYPLDWLLNKTGSGDVFVLRASNAKKNI